MNHDSRQRPKRSLGQNFLVDPNLQRKIVAALGAGPDDEVVEIGPGRGALTEHLVDRVGRLVLVELDDALAAGLAEAYATRNDVEVVHGDVLARPLAGLVADVGSARVIGNIPYNITTPILFHLLARPRPLQIVLLVQEEVAERLVAAVGTKAYGALTVGVRAVADAERLFRVGRKAFRPVPGVESAVVRLTPHGKGPSTPEEETRLRTVVRAAFQWRRKQMGRILRSHPDIALEPSAAEEIACRVGFELADRPETLSPEQFVQLALALP